MTLLDAWCLIFVMLNIYQFKLKFTFLFKFAIWSMYNIPLKWLLPRFLQMKIYKIMVNDVKYDFDIIYIKYINK
jgi:hypothetical protein